MSLVISLVVVGFDGRVCTFDELLWFESRKQDEPLFCESSTCCLLYLLTLQGIYSLRRIKLLFVPKSQLSVKNVADQHAYSRSIPHPSNKRRKLRTRASYSLAGRPQTRLSGPQGNARLLLIWMLQIKISSSLVSGRQEGAASSWSRIQISKFRDENLLAFICYFQN